MANVLVLGGAGFIGSHTLLALEGAGHTPIAYDNLSNGHADSVLNAELVIGDIHDAKTLTAAIETHSIDAIIHFAAFIEAGESMKDPMAFYRNNTAGTLSVLQVMQAVGLRPIVFSSTAAVYGQQDNVEILTEDLSGLPINPYGHSKWSSECMIRDLATTGAIDGIALRYFNAAGSDPMARIGERHDPETHLIPLVLDAARGTRPDIRIFGTDYDTPDGTCIRDYIHVSDLANAHVKALDHLLNLQTGKCDDAGFFDAFNLGTGRGFSVRDVVETAKDVTGVNFPVVEEARRPGDPTRLVADASKAQSKLGWQPEYPNLKDMIRHTWAFRKNL